MSVTTPDGVWEVVPMNGLAGIPLAVISMYILIRALLFAVALTDVYAGVSMKYILFPNRSKWFPDKRGIHKAVFHCILGGIILVAYLLTGEHFGWLKFIEKQ